MGVPKVLWSRRTLTAALVLLAGCREPLARSDICFEEDWPGANDRFTTFTPVRCSNRSQKLGPEIGADYGRLSFDDLDGDGVPEVIVQSQWLRCSFSGACTPGREVLRVELTDPPRITQLTGKAP